MTHKTITDLYELLTGQKEYHFPMIMSSSNYTEYIQSKVIGLSPNKSYIIKVKSGQTILHFENIIKDKNDSFNFYSPISKTWKTFTLPQAIWYNVDSINQQLANYMLQTSDITQQEIDNKDFKITLIPNEHSLGTLLVLAQGFKVDFNIENSLNEILGFRKQIYDTSPVSSEMKVRIHPNRKYYITCNNVNSYSEIGRSDVIYTFQPKKGDIMGDILDFEEGMNVELINSEFNYLKFSLINQKLDLVQIDANLPLYLNFVITEM